MASQLGWHVEEFEFDFKFKFSNYVLTTEFGDITVSVSEMIMHDIIKIYI